MNREFEPQIEPQIMFDLRTIRLKCPFINRVIINVVKHTDS